MSHLWRRHASLATVGLLAALLFSACGETAQGGDADPDQVDSVEVPELSLIHI